MFIIFLFIFITIILFLYSALKVSKKSDEWSNKDGREEISSDSN